MRAARCAPSPACSTQPPRRLNGRLDCCVGGDRLRAVMFSIARVAKRADLSHRKTSCLQEWAAKKPTILSDSGSYCGDPLTAAPAASLRAKALSG
jgi:hypothetical protein